MARPLRRIGVAVAASAALHVIVLARTPAIFAASPSGEPAPAGLEVRLAAAPPAPSNDVVGRSPVRAGSEVAAGPQRGAVRGQSYLRASELDTRPAPLASITPATPAAAAKTPGQVIARVLINEHGRVDAVQIVSSVPHAVFDEAVKSAFGKARYRPGARDGRPVKSQMLVEVIFHPEEQASGLTAPN